MTTTINANNRVNYILERFSDLNSQRIISIALPFLALHSKTAPISGAVIGLSQCYTLYHSNSDAKLKEGVLLISNLAFGYFCPVGQLALSNLMLLGSNLQKLRKAENRQEQGAVLLQLMSQAIHISSLYYGTPALIVLSLLSQATTELVHSYNHYQEGKTPELLAALLLAGIRLNKARTMVFIPEKSEKIPAKPKMPEKEIERAVPESHPHEVILEKVSPSEQPPERPLKQARQAEPRISEKDIEKAEPESHPHEVILEKVSPSEQPPERPLKQVTQQDWYTLIWKIQRSNQSGSPCDVAALLQEEGFTNEVSGIKSHHDRYVNCNFQNLKFENCSFEESKFINCTFEQMNFNNCSWKGAFLNNATFRNSTFNNCDFLEAACYKSTFESTTFNLCDLFRSNWVGTSFDHVTLQEGKLSESSFLQSSVKNSQLIDCDLLNALLLDAKEGFTIQGGTPHEITKPILALGWYLEGGLPYAKLIREALWDNGTLVLHYEQDLPNKESSSLKSEVIAALEKSGSSDQSIGHQLLLNALPGSEIDRLNQTAQEILKHANGLVIPGGADIEPFFYDRSAPLSSNFDFRSILELALLEEANRRKVPTMGICRGAQMINVYFGGTLLQDVKGEWGVKHPVEWTETSAKEQLRKMLPEQFNAVSMHHQAVDKVGEGLNVVLKRNKVPKLIVSQDGNFIASQIHPETYVQILEEFGEIFEVERDDLTASELEMAKKISLEFQKKMEEMQANYPATKLTNRIFATLQDEALEMAKLVDFIFANKNIYRFFLNKVESFRKTSISPS